MEKMCDTIIAQNLSKLVDVSQENGECKEVLQSIADKDNSAVLAFIAPYVPVRISPVEILGASIGLSEEFAMLCAVEDIKKAGVDKLYLLINTPGGYVASSYKIAKLLRNSFGEIKAFIPHVAASGGTMVALSANSVVMGPMSNVTPIDTQIPYRGQYVSSYSMNRALSRLSDFFEKITADEAPYPWRAMAEKLDPIFMEDWSSYLTEIQNYAVELMKMSGYKPDETFKIIDALIYPVEPHSFVIDKERAERIGIRVSKSSEDINTLKVMKAWLTGYMLKESQKHIIRYLIPTRGQNNDKAIKKKNDRKVSHKKNRAA